MAMGETLTKLFEDYPTLEEQVYTRGPKIYGVFDRKGAFAETNTQESRLRHLRLTLGTMTLKDESTLDWVDLKRHSKISDIEKLQKRKFRLPSFITTDREPEEIPNTMVEAFRIPEIKSEMKNVNLENGNPSFIVVEAFSRWSEEDLILLDYYSEVSEEVARANRSKVAQTYEHFLFGAGGTDFINSLYELSIKHFVN